MREKRWVNKGFVFSGTNVDYPSQSFVKVLDLELLSKKLHKPFGNHLRKLCGYIHRICGNKVYFVHQTARKFRLDSDPTPNHTFGYHLRPFGWKIERLTLAELNFLRENNHLPRNDHSSWKHSMRLDVATRYLLQVCVDYIGMFKSLDQEVFKQQMSAGQYYERHAFLRYSSLNWVEHYRAFRKNSNKHFDSLFDRSRKYFMVELWLTVYFTSLPSEEGRRRETRVEKPANPEESFQRLLDFSSLSGIDTEVYDEESIEGDQYWKEARNDKRGDRSNDTKDDEFTKDRSELIVLDRVQHLRRIHRKQVQERIRESLDPISAGSGNPGYVKFFTESKKTATDDTASGTMIQKADFNSSGSKSEKVNGHYGLTGGTGKLYENELGEFWNLANWDDGLPKL